MGKKIYDGTTLIHINKCNTDKQNLEKIIGEVDKNIPDTSGLVNIALLNTKISEVENKILDSSSLLTTTIPNKVSEIENEFLAKHITTQ